MFQAKLKVYGLVQGVGFRYSARREAKRLQLTGYAKNLSDGTVEILLCGEKPNIKDFIEWCKEGPRLAQVAKLDIKWEEPDREYVTFEI